jgi:hypothetical protein
MSLRTFSVWRRLSIAAHGVLGMVLLGALSTPQAHAANIITFGDNANACGSSVMCSTNGTTGYLNNGAGEAFDLSTLKSWFQIDTTGTNLLPGSQTEAEPDGGAGGYLVVNNTGALVTTFSITIADDFTSSTPSVTFCSGSSGPLCDNFQANKGALTGTSESLSGPDFNKCTNPNGASPCTSTAGQAAANFTAGDVTFTWSGLNIAAGKTFDISFASWNNNAVVVTPEPSSLFLMLLLGTGLIAAAPYLKRRLG